MYQTYNPDESGMTDKQKALNQLYYEIDQFNLECVDNIRVANSEDWEAVDAYKEAAESGCCGYHDSSVIINGVKWWIGCNYGH